MMNSVENNKLPGAIAEAIDAVKSIWWLFFDWVAVVSWKRLALVWLVAIIATAMLGVESLAGNFIILSVAVKVLAGGKRKAELLAKCASDEAKVADLGRKLAEAQMSALQAQVEPHFLFNTLAMIGQLIETDPKQAMKIHMSLVSYLRSAIPMMRAGGVATIGAEVDLSQHYLAIMQERMGDRLSVTFNVQPHLIDVPFPSMMLQILIENAIKHGLEPKIEGGHIIVTISSTGDRLQVSVEDNGDGFSPFGRDGTGLSNIRDRLKIAYAQSGELTVQQRAVGRGTHARITVPFNVSQK